MGRATITSGGEYGLYEVDIDYGYAEREAAVTLLENRQAELEAAIVASQDTIDGYNDNRLSLKADQSAAIVVYNASEKTPADKKALQETTNLLAANDQLAEEEGVTKAGYQLELINVKSRITSLNSLLLFESGSMWCADWSQAATGQVATIEVNGATNTIVIAPGGHAAQPTDGYMLRTDLMGAGQFYYNMAVMPGWQKHMPTYRSGTITSIAYATDTCNVDLDEARSSQQNLNINQAESLTSVPIEYMSCHSAVFEVDDRVIVRFDGQDWENPKVIGFIENPKPCYAKRIYVAANMDWDNRVLVREGASQGDFDSFYLVGSRTAEITYPVPSQYHHVYTYDLGIYDDPQPGVGGLGMYLPLSRWHIGMALDFSQNVWGQDTGPDGSGETYYEIAGGITLNGYGTAIQVGVKGTVPNDLSVLPEATRIKLDSDTMVPAGTVTFREGEHDEVTYNTATGDVTIDAYTMITEIPWYPAPPVVQDRAHAQNHILTYWDQPPEYIQVWIAGEWIDYVFEAIGPRPDKFGYNEIHDPSWRDPGDTWGVIYRQVNYLDT